MKYQIGFVLLRWSTKCKNSALLIQRGLRLLGPFLFASPLSFQVRQIWQLGAEFSSEKTLLKQRNEFVTGKYFSCRKLQQFLAWVKGSILCRSQSSPIFLFKGPVILAWSRITWDAGPLPKNYCDNCVHFTFLLSYCYSFLFLHSYFSVFIQWRMPTTPSAGAGTLMVPQGCLGLRSRGKWSRLWYFTLWWSI